MVLTARNLRDLLHYDPETGSFTWRVGRGAGKAAGSVVRKRGRLYFEIGIGGKRYQAHRLAVLYMTGRWPYSRTDHRDGDGLNNRWNNLREATNTSGFKGVTFNRLAGRWQAQIKQHGKTHYLGLFDTPEAGHAAYLAKAQELFGDYARAQ